MKSDHSHEYVESILPDCLNVVNGFPNLINLTLDGSVNNVPALLILDTAADVSMCSSNLVSSSDSRLCRRTISGIDNVNHSLPCYLLPLSTHGVQGKCLFASFPKLPLGSVLATITTNMLVVIVGTPSHTLLIWLSVTPNKVLVTRAQAKAHAKVEHECQLRHAVEGATPISVDSIQDDETVILYSDTDTPSNF